MGHEVLSDPIVLMNRIQHFEAVARRLEPDSKRREFLFRQVFQYCEEFLDTIHESPAFHSSFGGRPNLEDSPISEDPIDIQSALELIRNHVDRPGLNPASGGHLAYIPGGGLYPSSLGDYLAGVTNRYAGVFFTGPGAVRMERILLKWMADLLNYPDTAGGDLTSGGSIANLVGIVCAREASGIQAKDYHRTVVYLTRHIHHSVEKALRIAGMKESIQRYIEVDETYRMRTDVLEAAISQDERAGFIPWIIFSSAGTTDTGAIDPLDRIGDIANRKGLWFHIDAAYGGFFLLCEDGRKILKGIDKGDSVVMDPHKGLFLPYGSGAVLVKSRRVLHDAHVGQPHYLQDARERVDEDSPADHSPELTRHFRGLRLWLPLKLFGVAPFRACLEEKRLLARYFFNEIQKVNGFEVGPFPELSVVTYRYVPKRGDANEFNRRLIQEVQKDGRIFLSSTILDGKFVLRLAVLSFRTHLDWIDLALKVLWEKVRFLEGGKSPSRPGKA
ncbi:MAG: pyridoxal phosphate-dependent decarboxylase family protein [Candidatus Binatia bacterium]